MPSRPDVACLAVNHLNFVVEDFDGAVARLDRLVGAQFIQDLPQAEWHAGLVYFAGVMVELFSPAQPLVTARYGDHYVGIEYQTADVTAAREAVQRRGIRVVRDVGVAFHTHPRDCYGIGFEFFDGNFHTGTEWNWLEPFRAASYWVDSHPLGIRRMRHYGLVVRDLDGAATFLESFLGARLEPGPGPALSGVRAATYAVANTVIELMSPTGPGPVRDHLDRYGDGIRSITLEVANLENAHRYLAAEGVSVAVGDRDGALAFDLSPSGGLRCELVEGSVSGGSA